jgi:hypothetical protein
MSTVHIDDVSHQSRLNPREHTKLVPRSSRVAAVLMPTSLKEEKFKFSAIGTLELVLVAVERAS